MKASVTDLNEIPEALRGEYELRDGKHVLKVEGDDLPGFVPAVKHAVLRENNIKVFQALGAKTPEEALARAATFAGIDPAKLEKLKGIDPEEYAALKTKVEGFEKKGVKQPDDIHAMKEEIKAEIRAAMVKPLEDKLAAADARNAASAARIAKSTIRDAVTSKFTKAGGRADTGVLDFILSRAEESFRVVDEKVVAAEGRFGPQGEPLTVDEWISSATKEHAFAFDLSKGGGAPGGAGIGAAHKPGNGIFKLPGGKELKTEGITVLNGPQIRLAQERRLVTRE